MPAWMIGIVVEAVLVLVVVAIWGSHLNRPRLA